jgi:ribonuclease HI
MKKTEIRGECSLYFDGGSRGNPGKSGSGFVLYDASGNVIKESSIPIVGPNTNNFAEYTGLLEGLKYIQSQPLQSQPLQSQPSLPSGFIKIFGDSKLVIEQVSGRWKVNAENLRPLHQQCRDIIDSLQRNSGIQFYLKWIPRSQNAYADRLSNIAMDQ